MITPNNLVISMDSYSWILYAIGHISRSPESYIVLVVTNDSVIPIHNAQDLHEDVVYLQRYYDLKKVGRYLGISKITNLRYHPSRVDIAKLVATLQIQIMLGGIKDIIYQKSFLLDEILAKMDKRSQFDLNIMSYGQDVGNIQIELTEDERSKKGCLIGSLMGISTDLKLTVESVLNTDRETFNKECDFIKGGINEIQLSK
uniref:Uncharacterized protein n=1 Tax=viral metagenome TaxID=1070528 RepID=A0A6M3JK83_9ZZZZ